MSISRLVKSYLALTGKKQIELATYFGMSKQTMNTKFARDSWSAKDLAKVAEFSGGRLILQTQDGQQINVTIDQETGEPEE